MDVLVTPPIDGLSPLRILKQHSKLSINNPFFKNSMTFIPNPTHPTQTHTQAANDTHIS